MFRRDGHRVHRAVLLYVTLAYGLTWAVWFPYVRAARAGDPLPGPFLYYLAAFDPCLGAVVAECYDRRAVGVSDLLGRLVESGLPPGRGRRGVVSA